MLVLSLPLTLPVTLLAGLSRRCARCRGAPSPTSRCSRCGWVSSPGTAASRWAARCASAVQLVQPFLSLLVAVPLLGERLDAATVAFSLAVIATVFLGKKMPTHRPNRIQRTGESHELHARPPRRTHEPLGDPRDPQGHREAGIVSLAGGLPSRRAFRSRRCAPPANACCATRLHEALQYAASEGFGPLREWVAAEMARTACAPRPRRC